MDGDRGDLRDHLRAPVVDLQPTHPADRYVPRVARGHGKRPLGHGRRGRRNDREPGDRVSGAELFLPVGVSHGRPHAPVAFVVVFTLLLRAWARAKDLRFA